MYNEFRFGDFSYGSRRLDTEPLFKKLLGKADSETQLFDIGCGTGSWTKFYLDYGVLKESVTLLDLASANVTELRRNGFRAIQGDVLNLPFANNVSDLTICDGVIHHTADPFKAFCELVRITKPGGYIYLNVYNAWNPYFYLVHRATFLFRYWYWHWNKNIAGFLYFFAKLIFQPLAYIVFGKFLDEQTGRTLFMDQVMTPIAVLFTKQKIKTYAKKCDCRIEDLGLNKGFLMIAAVIKVEG